MDLATQIFTILNGYKALVEKKISENFNLFGPNENSQLRKACEYSLSTEGKRFRPALVLIVAKALGKNQDASDSALAIEFFHTASLIADDLPCMDNDDFRRNQPTLHKVFGESVALLTTYTLISAGYGLIGRNARLLVKPENAFYAIENAAFNTGVEGASGGQLMDIYPPQIDETILRDIVHKKTVSLYEIAFVFGWIFGGGDIERIDEVKKAAKHFGMAFQILDDIDDESQDQNNERQANFAVMFGKAKALELFDQEIDQYEKQINDLNIDGSELLALSKFLTFQAKQLI